MRNHAHCELVFHADPLIKRRKKLSVCIALSNLRFTATLDIISNLGTPLTTQPPMCKKIDHLQIANLDHRTRT